MNKILLFTLLFLSINTLNASPSEIKLKAIIISKVARFVTWENTTQTDFVITVLSNPFGNLLNKLYDGKKIKGKNIKIKYLDIIDHLEYTNILYIPSSESPNLKDILKKIKCKNILTISSIRGFAEKKGVLQIYFTSQKIKLKINLDTARRDHLKIKSSLLRIATIIKEEK